MMRQPGVRALAAGLGPTAKHLRLPPAGHAQIEKFNTLGRIRLRTSGVGIGEDQFNPANQSARGGPETSTTAGGELGSAGGRS
jgi:hypothetical protein